jgi:hypothetical protein
VSECVYARALVLECACMEQAEENVLGVCVRAGWGYDGRDVHRCVCMCVYVCVSF